ncbi:hypothetical protein SAMN04487770_1781 [Butyrivibrio sp. ob235]|uniref:hypothetical protein n=1 Tax=Butyrivibrio sp. ob235 TaxID=1761780 RepID=UPI0008D3175D|nr:hypothetical protein [Butyrivibrio sp. ob235]SEM71298.1 hypothetical protein SAMN04487770_1781 [Butyrivibrio sp. ob235]
MGNVTDDMGNILGEFGTTLNKLTAVMASFKNDSMMDFENVNQEQLAVMLYNHRNNASLFSVMEDYINKLNEIYNNCRSEVYGESAKEM